MDTKTVRKIGNSIGVTFNGTLASAVSCIQLGDKVTVVYQKNKITIVKEATK